MKRILTTLIALVTFAFNGFRFHASLPTLLLGLLNALMLFIYNTSLIKASRKQNTWEARSGPWG